MRTPSTVETGRRYGVVVDLGDGGPVGEPKLTRRVVRTARRSDVKNADVSVTTLAPWRITTSV
jgi:hypothetical protein